MTPEEDPIEKGLRLSEYFPFELRKGGPIGPSECFACGKTCHIGHRVVQLEVPEGEGKVWTLWHVLCVRSVVQPGERWDLLMAVQRRWIVFGRGRVRGEKLQDWKESRRLAIQTINS